MEDIGEARRLDVLSRHLAQHRGPAHLVDEIMREGIGTETNIDAEAPVLAEILQQDPAPSEDVRAVRDRATRARHALKVTPARPADPAVLVDENAMRYGGTIVEDAELIEPFERGLAVASRHLAKLDHTLRGMDLQRRVTHLRGLDARLQQLRGAGIDLRRRQHAEEPSALVPPSGIDHAQRLRHSVASRRLVPLVFDAVTIAGEPTGRPI